MLFLHTVQVLGHAWFGGSSGSRASVGGSSAGSSRGRSSGPRQLLPYVQARQRIYLPAYNWVLEHKVQAQLQRIAHSALQQPVVLLDYETNCDVADASRPLSHASLVAAHVREHWRSLVS